MCIHIAHYRLSGGPWMQLPSWLLVSFAFQDHPPSQSKHHIIGQITVQHPTEPLPAAAFSLFFSDVLVQLSSSNTSLLCLPPHSGDLASGLGHLHRRTHPPLFCSLMLRTHITVLPGYWKTVRNGTDGRVKWLMLSNTGQKRKRWGRMCILEHRSVSLWKLWQNSRKGY